MQGLKQKKSTTNKSLQGSCCLSAGWVSKQLDTTWLSMKGHSADWSLYMMLPYNLLALCSTKFFSSSIILVNEFSLNHPRQHSAEAQEPQSSLGAVILIIISNTSLTRWIALEFSVLYMVSLSTYSFSQSLPLCFVMCTCINHLSDKIVALSVVNYLANRISLEPPVCSNDW